MFKWLVCWDLVGGYERLNGKPWSDLDTLERQEVFFAPTLHAAVHAWEEKCYCNARLFSVERVDQGGC